MTLRGSILLLACLPFLALGQGESYAPRDPSQAVYLSQGFDQKLDAQVPLDITLVNEQGQPVQLGELLSQERPVVLNLVYYRCPGICNVVLNGLVKGMREIAYTVGKDFDVLTVSFNHDEDHVLAAAKKVTYVNQYNREGANENWHWLVGSEDEIRRLTDAVGFHFKWNPDSNEFAHPAGILLLTPEGRISRYLFGSDFNPRDLRFGLVDAGEGRIGSISDKLTLLCYSYSPEVGQYTLLINRIVMIACLATAGALGTLVWFLFRSETGRPRNREATV